MVARRSRIWRCYAINPTCSAEVASTPTAWRTLEAIDAAALERIAQARAAARRRVWAAGADPGFYVVDFDGTLITSHSDKAGAEPTYKRGFGFHPLLAFLDATGEALGRDPAPRQRRVEHRGRSRRVARPWSWRSSRSTRREVEVIARADSAGSDPRVHRCLRRSERAVQCRSRSHRTGPDRLFERPGTSLATSDHRRWPATTATAPRSPRSPTWSTWNAGRPGLG